MKHIIVVGIIASLLISCSPSAVTPVVEPTREEPKKATVVDIIIDVATATIAAATSTATATYTPIANTPTLQAMLTATPTISDTATAQATATTAATATRKPTLKPTVRIAPTVAVIPTVFIPPTDIPAPAPVACCKHCTPGKSIACGDTCISASKTCHTAPGCACNN